MRHAAISDMLCTSIAAINAHHSRASYLDQHDLKPRKDSARRFGPWAVLGRRSETPNTTFARLPCSGTLHKASSCTRLSPYDLKVYIASCGPGGTAFLVTIYPLPIQCSPHAPPCSSTHPMVCPTKQVLYGLQTTTSRAEFLLLIHHQSAHSCWPRQGTVDATARVPAPYSAEDPGLSKSGRSLPAGGGFSPLHPTLDHHHTKQRQMAEQLLCSSVSLLQIQTSSTSQRPIACCTPHPICLACAWRP